MGKRKILPGIVAVYDSEELSFLCDDEVIEDMEFTWDDLDDSELLREVADELVEYLDVDDLDELDNPRATVVRKLKKLHKDRGGASPSEDHDDYEDDDDEDDDL
jgi:hypothetical protein